MPTNSNIVTDQDINDAKKNIRSLMEAKSEVDLAIKAGLVPSTTLQDLTAKIDKLKLFIKVYSGENINP